MLVGGSGAGGSGGVGQVDIEQLLEGSFVRSLEESGFLPEMRRRLKD